MEINGQFVLTNISAGQYVPPVSGYNTLYANNNSLYLKNSDNSTTTLLPAATSILTPSQGDGISLTSVGSTTTIAISGVVLYATQSSGQTITAGARRIVVYNNVVTDTLGQYSVATGAFTAKVAGNYVLYATTTAAGATTQINYCFLYKNGAETHQIYKIMNQPADLKSSDTFYGAAFRLAVGDYIEVRQQYSATLSLTTNPTYNTLQIIKV